MNRRHKESWCQTFFLSIFDELLVAIDQSLEYVFHYVELPIENALSCVANLSTYYYRRPIWFDFTRNITQILAQGYIISFVLYFIFFFLAQLYSLAIQRYYFLDPILSADRQCVDIRFVRVDRGGLAFDNAQLTENFVRENLIVGEESHRKLHQDYTELHTLFDALRDNFFVICQRSLYLYARFHSYSPLLHSNHSHFRFSLPNYPASFAIDQPPFVDLCVHTFNRSHLERVHSRLRPLASQYYPSVNLFLFNFHFTQVSVTLYEFNKNSTHLERVSIHTGWLRDLYSQFPAFKYDHALSTVLFDGLSAEQSDVDYFQYRHIPVPADPLLGLNEMVQESMLVLPLCQSKPNSE